jgi:hypothetical protein
MYVDYFKKSNDGDLVYCCDVESLLAKMGVHSNVQEDWWLFIDGSVRSVKTVLLHVNNNFPAIPIGYSRTLKESYDSMKQILELIQYDNFKWKVCSDLKVIGLLTVMQGGYTKYLLPMFMGQSCQ